MSPWTFGIPIGIGVVQTFLMVWQLRLMIAANSSTAVVPASESRWRRYWPIPTMAVLMILSWAPYILLERMPAQEQRIGWHQPLIRGQTFQANYCNLTVDVAQLVRFADKYDVAIVCGLFDPTIDKFQDTRITATKPFVIRYGDPLMIAAPYSEVMSAAIQKEAEKFLKLARIPKGASVPLSVNTWIEIVLVPSGSGTSWIEKLSDIPKHNGKILSQEPL